MAGVAYAHFYKTVSARCETLVAALPSLKEAGRRAARASAGLKLPGGNRRAICICAKAYLRLKCALASLFIGRVSYNLQARSNQAFRPCARKIYEGEKLSYLHSILAQQSMYCCVLYMAALLAGAIFIIRLDNEVRRRLAKSIGTYSCIRPVTYIACSKEKALCTKQSSCRGITRSR